MSWKDGLQLCLIKLKKNKARRVPPVAKLSPYNKTGLSSFILFVLTSLRVRPFIPFQSVPLIKCLVIVKVLESSSVQDFH